MVSYTKLYRFLSAITIPTLVALSCTHHQVTAHDEPVRVPKADTAQAKNPEPQKPLTKDFEVFLADFPTDIDIQKQRISDDAMDILVIDSVKTLTKKLDKPHWKLVKLTEQNRFSCITNTTENDSKDTGERVGY